MIDKDKKNRPEFIKSGYVYNITKFITWPMNAFNFSVSPFILGVFGDKSIGSPLVQTLREKKIRGRDWKLDFYRIPEEIRNCHLVLITGVSTEQAGLLISFLKQKYILTIGDNIPNFCELGGLLNIVGTVPDLGFEINLEAFKLAKLEISQELIDLSTII